MMTEDRDDILQHFGVTGMKWGVRRTQAALASARAERNEIKRSKDKTRFKTSAKKLTDSELDTRIKRMQTEKQYNELNKRTVSKGQAAVVDVLTNSSKSVAQKTITGAGNLAVKTALKNKFGEEIAAEVTKKQK